MKGERDGKKERGRDGKKDKERDGKRRRYTERIEVQGEGKGVEDEFRHVCHRMSSLVVFILVYEERCPVSNK